MVRTSAFLLLVLLCTATAVEAAPTSAAFTYQGELTDNGQPQTGFVDLQMTLYDTAAGGVAVGSTIQLATVPLTNGRFTVQLDYGDVFDGEERWIEIGVRYPHDLTDTLPFATMNPRQPVSAVPYAQRALGAVWDEASGAPDVITNQVGTTVGINSTDALAGGTLRVHTSGAATEGGVWASTELGSDPEFGYWTGPLGDKQARTYLDGGTGAWNLESQGVVQLTVTESGEVGIGAQNPSEVLDVDGTVRSRTGGFRFPDGTLQTTAASSSGGNTLDDAYDEGGLGAGRQIFTSNGAVNLSGTFGLEIATSSSNPGLRVDGNGSGHIAQFFDDGAPILTIDSQGDVGIGIQSGTMRLDVREETESANVMNLERSVASVAAADMLQIRAHVDGADGTQFIECERGIDVEFRVNGNGDVTADGTFSGPADFAEMVKVTSGVASVQPGDVMIIDPNSERGFAKSSSKRSSLVAGVYSTNPGFLGSEHDWDQIAVERGVVAKAAPGEEQAAMRPVDIGKQIGEVPLAVVGIVPCKVSAENGPIRAGDLLVTASLPGHAMRDEKAQAGTIVGKALGALSSGTGVIKILVTLQ